MNYHAENKVTVGFRCPPSLKNQLMQQAENQQISLSEFVENLVLNYNSPPPKQSIPMLPDDDKLRELTQRNLQLEKRLAQYETPLLRQLFENLKYQNVAIKDMPDVVSKLVDTYANQNR